MCVYVCMSKQEYFLSRIKVRGQFVLTYMYMCAGMPRPRFFQNEENASQRTGSAPGEMLMEFIIKRKIKSNFSTNL